MIGRSGVKAAATEELPPVPAAVMLPRINLLPVRIRVDRQLRRVRTGLGAIVAGAIGLVALLSYLAAGQVTQEQARLDAAQDRNRVLQRQAAQFADVRKAYAAVDSARATLRSALAGEVRYSSLLSALSTHVPPTVQVTAATWTQAATGLAPAAASNLAPAPASPSGVSEGPSAVAGATPTTPTGVAGTVLTTPRAAVGTVTFTGIASSHDEVARWLESLTAQPALSDATFTTSTKVTTAGGIATVTFSSSAVLNSAALSGRYTGPDGGLK